MLTNSNDLSFLGLLPQESSAIAEVRQINYAFYELTMAHEFGSYILEIKEENEWYTYGTLLTPGVKGARVGEFYQSILEMNRTMNGPRLAIQSESVIMVWEEARAFASPATIIRAIVSFHAAHREFYPLILEKAAELDLEFISPY